MAFGTFGLGLVAAQWLTTKTATQSITVQGMSFTLASVNGTVAGNTVTCAPLAITSGSGEQTTAASCDFEIAQTAGAAPASIIVTETATYDGTSKFVVSPIVSYGVSFGTILSPYNGGLYVPLASTATVITDNAAATHLPFKAQLPVGWGTHAGPVDLVGNEAPDTVTYTIAISA